MKYNNKERDRDRDEYLTLIHVCIKHIAVASDLQNYFTPFNMLLSQGNFAPQDTEQSLGDILSFPRQGGETSTHRARDESTTKNYLSLNVN